MCKFCLICLFGLESLCVRARTLIHMYLVCLHIAHVCIWLLIAKHVRNKVGMHKIHTVTEDGLKHLPMIPRASSRNTKSVCVCVYL